MQAATCSPREDTSVLFWPLLKLVLSRVELALCYRCYVGLSVL